MESPTWLPLYTNSNQYTSSHINPWRVGTGRIVSVAAVFWPSRNVRDIQKTAAMETTGRVDPEVFSRSRPYSLIFTTLSSHHMLLFSKLETPQES